MAENIFDQVDIAQLECHFKWFKEQDNASSGQWLASLVNKQLHNDLMCDIDVSEGEKLEDHDTDLLVETASGETYTLNGNRLEMLSWKCTLILRNTFGKNFVEAFRLSNELLNVEEAHNVSQPQVHIDSFFYVMLANQLNILKEWHSFGDCTVDENHIVEIEKRFESLKDIFNSNEAKAFINVMKSNLSRDMQNTQSRIDFAKAATELNPQFASWYQCLYLALRFNRRSTDYCQRPSQLEIDACVKAYELGLGEHSDNILIGHTVQMAKLYTELVLTCRRGSQEHHEMSELAIKFTRESMLLSKSNSKVLKIRLVSFLTGHHIYRRNRDQGIEAKYAEEVKELVKECEKGVCSSEVCHGLGKFYNNSNLVEYDSAKALQWFERGLEAHIGNFPCFADMLRNVNFRLKPTSEIVRRIDTILSSQSRQTYGAQLHFIKGFFLWSDDMEASLHSWLMAMEVSADSKINFVGLATRNFCYIKDGNCEQASKMMNNVKFFMSRRELDDPVFTKLKNIVNSIIEYFERQPRVVQVRQNAGTHQQQRNYGVNRRRQN